MPQLILPANIPQGLPIRRAMGVHARNILLPTEVIVPQIIDLQTAAEDWDPEEWGRKHLGEEYTEDVCALMQSVRENTITIARSANGTGKTHAAARLAISFYKSLPGAKVFTTAEPYDNLKKLLWGELGKVVQDHPELFIAENDRKNPHSKLSLEKLLIQRAAEEYIAGLTIPKTGTEQSREGKFSGKHAPFLLFVIDEADVVPEFVFRGIESCMSGGFMVRLLLLFNPRSQSGYVYQMEQEERGNVVELTAFNHPNVRTGIEVIPGAVNREITVRRINKWSRPLVEGESADAECFRVPDFLVDYIAKDDRNREYPKLPAGWRKVETQELYYMTLARYPAVTEDQLISAAWIDAAFSRWVQFRTKHGDAPIPGVSPVLGLDVAEMGKDKNCLTIRYGSYVARQILWSGVDTTITESRAAKYYWQYRAQWINVDANGIGAGVAPHLRNDHLVNAFGIKVQASPNENDLTEEMKAIGEFKIIRDQMLWSLREWLRTDPSAMLPRSERLRAQLLSLNYANKKGKIKITDSDTIKEKVGHSPDELMSLALTFAHQPETEDNSLNVDNYIGLN